ncbi:hypothetical protein GC175_16610 [bacterium]|nr:hypothetical protein [bacterium]
MPRKNPSSSLRIWMSLFGIGILAALFLGLVFVRQMLPDSESNAQPSALSPSTLQGQLVASTPPAVAEVQVQGPDGQWGPLATWTPFPTPPLPPTPTLIPGPTATPMPIAKPATDASGSIFYAVLGRPDPSAYFDSYNSLALYHAQMDEHGIVKGKPERLFEVVETEIDEIYPSPDGSRIVLVGPWGGRHVFYTDSGKVEPMFRNALDPMGLFFGWHPNSRQVLIRAEDNYTDVGLWLVDVDDGSHITLLADFPSPKFQGGAVSADGQKVVYSFGGEFTTPAELWMTDTKGSDHRPLSSFGGSFYAITWSPDGEKIAFVGDGLMIINADGSNPRTISERFGGERGFMPVWSPDSKTIAFTTGSTPEDIAKEELNKAYRDPFAYSVIYLVDVETGEERPLLSDGSTGHIDPAWSPDGTQIAFASMRSGNSEIWLVNADGTNLRQITDTGEQVRFPYWVAPKPQQVQP